MGEPCDRCGKASACSLGALRLCAGCWRTDMDVLNPGGGYGQIVGPASNWPAELWDLQCDVCGATWVGHEFSTCQWCLDRVAARSRLPDPRLSPAGDCALICPTCGWRWNGLAAEACRRPGFQCPDRGSHDLALSTMRREAQ